MFCSINLRVPGFGTTEITATPLWDCDCEKEQVWKKYYKII